ncbi:MAG: SMP-30/gluconolactonase/LRE family protein, partial [Cyanobacteria bacterium NC_groundwater_1444_Ag_S-0.65um_54_12]|nr:SMP-30/gluconolactonase/LRE family protein [Cyanobacteria bacterium NC_groundwater_1444_Ag_S-0.65um_54_12]
PYILEAVKGLAAGGNPNRVGSPAARLRTLVSRVNGSWVSITSPRLQISRSTTAISAIAGLKGFSTAQLRALLGKVTIGTPDTFAATTDLTAAEYSEVWILVDRSLGQNQDPIRAIARNTTTGTFALLDRGALVTELSSASGSIGEFITLYGNGFDANPEMNLVYFNGTAYATGTVDPTGTRLVVPIPTGAVTGPLTVRIGDLVANTAGKFRVSGTTLDTYAGTTVPGPGTVALDWPLWTPERLTVDNAGNIYVTANGADSVYRITPGGTITVMAGNGFWGYSGDGGPATSAKLDGPIGITLDTIGNLYIADAGNKRIRRVDTSGIITTVAGNGSFGYAGDGGPATSANFRNPNDVAIDGAGNLYIADTGNHRVRKVASNGIITTVAGNGTAAFAGDNGPATGASLNNPRDVLLDASGNLYIADSGNNRIRKVASNGTITTVAGNGTAAFAGDNGPATGASINSPRGMALDASGNLYIADASNHRIRKVDTSGTITTMGSGWGFSGDGGPVSAAKMKSPRGVAFDGAGNLYINDTNNNRIRQVNLASNIATIAGNGALDTFGGDGGPAGNALLDTPQYLTVDNTGNLYFSDTFNNRVRKVSPSGIISTVAGNGTAGYTGDNGPATSASLNTPTGLAVDSAGNLYIADSLNNVIRRVTPTGTITTVVGNGTCDYLGDGGSATSASLCSPAGIAISSTGYLYIADTDNSVIRRVTSGGIISTVAGNGMLDYSGDNGPATSASWMNFMVWR